MLDPVIEKRVPVLVLLGVISIITILDWMHGTGEFGQRSEKWMMTPAKVVDAWEATSNGDLSRDNLETLATSLTAGFLHADGSHLGGNMLFLWIFGVVVAELCGWRWMVAAFVITVIGGTIGHILFDPQSSIPCLGASGGVMGLEGFYFGLAFLHPRPDSHVWPLARPVNSTQLAATGVIGIALAFLGLMGPPSSIGHSAHIGGFVAGMLLATLANRFVPSDNER